MQTKLGNEIILSNGAMVFIDEVDFEKVSKITWYPHSAGYAVGHLPSPKKGIYPKVLMHRYIMNVSDDIQVDHINGNKLDNRRENLRLVNPVLNAMNSKRPKHNTTGYKGVTFVKDKNKFKAQITIGRKNKHLGYFNNPKKAHEAYVAYGKKLFGDYFKED